MKPRQESTATVITTPQQRRVIEGLMDKHLEEGGSVLAQAFPDGLRLRVLTPAQTNELRPALAKALGTPLSTSAVHSAFEVPEK